jgi:hypothetical protein
MSLSIEELDATVRTFYEGRGETVRTQQAMKGLFTAPTDHPSVAKASPGNSKSGSFILTANHQHHDLR